MNTIGRLTTASAVALILGTGGALAQDYGSSAAGYDTTESVEVTAPPYYRHHHPARSAIGAPIVDVSLSQPVRFADLDLTTWHGAHTLQARVRHMARKLCRRLNFEYPVSTADSPPCYRTAVREAMPQADAAIRQARYERDGYRRDDDGYRD